MERTDQYDTVHREARDLFQKKNQDYGDAFAEHGTVGVLVRIGDKLKRLVRVTRNGVNLVNDESLRDTLVDLHNYAAMAVMLMDEASSGTGEGHSVPGVDIANIGNGLG